MSEVLIALVLYALLAIYSVVNAQTGAPTGIQTAYPARPVKIVVGFPAGGGTDVFARAVAQGLSAALGQQFIVDNKPGAGGVIASQSLLQALADGYTLLMGSTSTQAIAPGRGAAPALAPHRQNRAGGGTRRDLQPRRFEPLAG